MTLFFREPMQRPMQPAHRHPSAPSLALIKRTARMYTREDNWFLVTFSTYLTVYRARGGAAWRKIAV